MHSTNVRTFKARRPSESSAPIHSEHQTKFHRSTEKMTPLGVVSILAMLSGALLAAGYLTDQPELEKDWGDIISLFYFLGIMALLMAICIVVFKYKST